HQVKIRGIRIELGEIEMELLQHEAVREAVVLVREDHPGEKRLVAYLVADGEQHPTPADLKQHLQAKLPKYMVPASYVMLEALPLNPSGKLDRHALPVPDSSHLVANGEYVAPRNRAEERVAEIFANTLHVESVSIHDNFFELGGHSLLATQVISRIIEEFGVQVTVRDLFACPSVAELTERVQSQATEGAFAQLAPPIVPVSREGQLRASFAQQRLWFADQMEANSAMYNMREVVRLTGPLDQEALLRSLNEIVRRHESLRTTIAEVDGQPIQIIRPFTPLEMPMIDLQAFAETEREEVALRIAVSKAQQPFDLQNDLLIRARLLKLGTEQHMLLVITHHIANDGWSTGVFYSELKALYEAYLAGAASPLPELPVQYADFAEWQRNWMQGDVLETQLAYWKQQLSGDLPILKVQSDRPRPAKSVCQGATLAMEVPHSLAKQLHQLSQRMGTSLYMPMLAAYQTLMYRYSGQEDFLIGSPIANRNHREIEGLIGFFVNMLTLRADLSGNPTFEELIQRVQQVALDAFAHQDLPFEKLVEELQPDRDLSQSPLFNAVFALQNAPRELWESNGLRLESVPIETEQTVFDLTLQATEEGETLTLEAFYNAEMYNRDTIERMLQHFERVLQGMVDDPSLPIDDVVLLSEQESHQLLVEWNDTATAYPKTSNLAALFEEQVAQTPDAVAVVAFDEEPLTYRELNERANQVARHLQKQGVQQGQTVGLCVERSLEMIVGLLGIVKAGAAYVPLDVNYPTERLRFMMEDAQVSLLVTQSPLVDRLPLHDTKVVCLDTDRQEIAAESVANPTCLATAESLLYVIYTSGSTGRPKGVLVPHRAVARLVKET
ncbi:MAG: condensation domain-containing protein, partial [Tumebacillaceae bacterium]